MNLLSFAAKSNEGPFLQTNEDTYDFDLEHELFFILDGYGGTGIGDTAAIRVKEDLKKFYLRFGDDPNVTLPFYFSTKYLVEANALINSLLYTHNNLMQENLKKPISQRAGASALLVSKSESILNLVSTGSCGAFIYRKGELQKIFIEDSFNFLSSKNYESYLKTMPLSGLGLFPDLHFQVKELRIVKGDTICFLTDGVYARLELSEITDIVKRQELNVNEKLDQLFDLANIKGNLDNQSGIVLQF